MEIPRVTILFRVPVCKCALSPSLSFFALGREAPRGIGRDDFATILYHIERNCRKNASGEYDYQDDGETVDAIFSILENGNLLYETANGIELEYDIMGH